MAQKTLITAVSTQRSGIFLLALLALIGEPGTASGQASTQPAGRRPNIIFLLADDQRFDALGCMGNREIRTPHLDRLAADGMCFMRHYDTTAICMASRASIMTGLYEYRHGCNFDRGSMGRETFRQSYPVVLRRAGYRVGFAGKFGFPVTAEPTDKSQEAEERLPVDEFDWWAGWVAQGSYETAKNPRLRAYAEKYPHVSRALGAAACDFIRESVAAGKPFCLSISFKAPHHPYTPDPLDGDLYKGTEFSKPPAWGRDKGRHLPEQTRRSRMYQDEFAEWASDQAFQASLTRYYQLINGNDVAVGMMREALATLGAASNTVIIYTSDNGWMCGDFGMGGKVFPYEPASRGPLIIVDPRNRSAANRASAALTGNIDMAPTILDFAGAPIPATMDGASLVPLLNKPDGQVHESLVLMNAWPWSAEQLVMGVVTSRFKYLYWFYGDASLEPAEELYDLRDDPPEMTNLAAKADRVDDLRRLRTIYDRQRAGAKASCTARNSYPEFLDSADRTVPWSQKKWTTKPMAQQSRPKFKRAS